MNPTFALQQSSNLNKTIQDCEVHHAQVTPNLLFHLEEIKRVSTQKAHFCRIPISPSYYFLIEHQCFLATATAMK